MAGPGALVDLYKSHELYNLGHLYEAAVAHCQATGKTNLFDIALKSADLIARDFGPGKRTNPPGHEEIEIGLVKLYRVTGTRKYLDLAKFFIDARGRTEAGSPSQDPRRQEQLLYGEYAQDHKPFVEQTEAVGHAVRAGYLYAGAADVAALTGDAAYIAALDKIWADMAGKKLYITGGIGAAGGWEGYGPAYHLPNPSAYAETCANIATFLWNSRMQRLELDAKYADVMERILYNGVLSGISLSRRPLLLSQPAGLLRPARADALVQLRLLPAQRGPHPGLGAGLLLRRVEGRGLRQPLRPGDGEDEGRRARTSSSSQTTDYPWKFDVKIEVKPAREAEFTLVLRIPGWALNRPVPTDLYRLCRSAPGDPGHAQGQRRGRPGPARTEKGYALISEPGRPATSSSFLPMPVRRVVGQRGRQGRPRPRRGRARASRLLRRVDRQRRPGGSNLVLPDDAAARRPRRGRNSSTGSSSSRARPRP